MGVFRGVGPAAPTFFKNGKVDYVAHKFHLEQLLKNKVDFVVPCGTTGESPTLDFDEHVEVIDATVQAIDRQIPVLAGTGSNNTAEAIRLTEAAKTAGANGALVVSPYYNKPTSKGLIDYYSQIAKVGIPVILYDIPGRTAKGVPVDVIIKLANEGIISGIKWASGNLDQLMQIVENVPDDFDILSGDDKLTFLLMTHGGHGVVSVVGNIIPYRMSLFTKILVDENLLESRVRHYSLLKLMNAMFLETNPLPVKTALALMYHDVIKEEFRSPMMPMDEKNREKLKKILESYDLIDNSGAPQELHEDGLHKTM